MKLSVIKTMERKWVAPVLDIRKMKRGLLEYRRFWQDWHSYAGMADSEPLSLNNAHPCLYDRVPVTPYDSHYFYQDIWALKCVKNTDAAFHIDIGSRAIFAGMLTAVTQVTFIDIRPLIVDLGNYNAQIGSILTLPFADNSINSLSCLHVAEHIGLGRYGDPLDPAGTVKATQELARVLAPGGHLYFSLPVGRPRVCFNAHRIHSPQQILQYFQALQLVEFSTVTDRGQFLQAINPEYVTDATYACGMFHFTKGPLPATPITINEK